MSLNVVVKYDIWERVKIDWEGSYKIVGYEYMEWRWMRYILLNWADYLYQYEPEMELVIETKTIWFTKE